MKHFYTYSNTYGNINKIVNHYCHERNEKQKQRLACQLPVTIEVVCSVNMIDSNHITYNNFVNADYERFTIK